MKRLLTFKRVFYSNKLDGLVVEHNINNVSKTKKYNHKLKTVFSIKDRVEGFRGLKSVWSALMFLLGFLPWIAFIR